MRDTKNLKEQLTAKNAEIDAAARASKEAEQSADADPENEDLKKAVTDAKATVDKIKAEFQGLLLEVEAAKQEAKESQEKAGRDAAVRELEALSQPADAMAAQIVRDGLPSKGERGVLAAQAVDYVQKAMKHNDVFYKWVAAPLGEEHRAISGEERKLLQPTSDGWKAAGLTGEATTGAVLPPRLAAKIMGQAYADAAYEAKVVSSLTDAVSNPSLAQNLVPQEFRRQLLQLPIAEPAIMDMVTVIPTATGTITVPALVQTDANETGGVAMTWTSEGGSKSETEPTFSQIEITVHELSGYTEFTERILSRSAIALEPLLTALYRDAINLEFDRVIFSGTGVGQPSGIIGFAGVRTQARQAANSVEYEDLVRLKHLVLPHHRGGARFYLNDDVELDLELETDTQNRPLFSASTSTGPYDRLVGYPYEVAWNSPTLGQNGDVVYGNPRHYWLVVEEQIVVAKSAHFRFRSNLIAFKVYMIAGGRPVQPRAFSYLVGVAGS